MTEPALLVLEDTADEGDCLRATLKRRYAQDYDVICEGSAAAALDRLTQLAFHEARLGRKLTGPWIDCDRLDVAHVGDKVVVGVEQLTRVRPRPGRVEHLLRRAHRHIGVDQ